MRFKEFLKEEVSDYFYTGRELLDFLNEKFGSYHWNINKDGTVDFDDSLIVIRNLQTVFIDNKKVLPIKLNIIHGTLQVRCNVNDYNFLPKEVKRTFYIKQETIGKTFDIKTEHVISCLPEHIEGECYLELPLEHLKDIHKHLKYCGNIIRIEDTIKSNILGLMMIKELSIIDLHSDQIKPTGQYDRLRKSIFIINKHLENKRDVLDCQEELVQAGFKEYAKL